MNPKKKSPIFAYLTFGALILGALLTLFGMMFERSAAGRLCWEIGMLLLLVSLVVIFVSGRKGKKQQDKEDDEAKKW